MRDWHANGQFSFDYYEASWWPPVFVSGESSACLVDNTGGPHVTGKAPGTCLVRITALAVLTRDSSGVPETYGPVEVRDFTINVI